MTPQQKWRVTVQSVVSPDRVRFISEIPEENTEVNERTGKNKSRGQRPGSDNSPQRRTSGSDTFRKQWYPGSGVVLDIFALFLTLHEKT